MKKKHTLCLAFGTFVVLMWLGVLLVYDVLDVRLQSFPRKHYYIQQPDINETIIRNFLKENPKLVAAILSEMKQMDDDGSAERLKKATVVLDREKKSNVVKPNEAPAVLKPPANPDGPGEMGKPVVLSALSEDDKKKSDDGWKTYQFNSYVSDLISIHRALPDVRDNRCKEPGRYLPELPDTSVIICFYNEAWTVLLRTVHSVLERSPSHLIKEIILVDDFSSLPHLKTNLDEYMAHIPNVKVIHNKKREGLIRARIIGAKAATAPVLTYLDSHCEVTPGWLEPLLDAVARDGRTAAIPTIDSINDSTFQYTWNTCDALQVGGFDWSLTYTWHALPKADKIGRHPCDNVKSPTMAGGLFTIGKAFFEEIGFYDQKMDIWGGENLEISFKIWMCGGRLEAVPCSHIGHIFRRNSPYAKEAVVDFGNFVRRNTVRVARVWLDEHADYYYQRTGTKQEEAGDVSEQVKLRDKLKCKSFQWYLNNIYPELFVPSDAIASGEVMNMGDGKTCLDSLGGKLHKPVGVYPCHKMGGNQYWSLTKDGEIRQDDGCMDYSGSGDVILYPCHSQEGNQYWVYNPQDHRVQHRVSKKCLGLDPAKKKIEMMPCHAGTYVHWKFQKEVPEKLLMLHMR